MYIDSGTIESTSFGQRAQVYGGQPDLRNSIDKEKDRTYIKKKEYELDRQGNMLVMGKYATSLMVPPIDCFQYLDRISYEIQ